MEDEKTMPVQTEPMTRTIMPILKTVNPLNTINDDVYHIYLFLRAGGSLTNSWYESTRFCENNLTENM